MAEKDNEYSFPFRKNKEYKSIGFIRIPNITP